VVLAECKSLASVDLSGLTSLTRGSAFLGEFTSLTAVDMSGLASLTHVGINFILGCKSLAAVDVSGLTAPWAVSLRRQAFCRASPE